jgi:hypothetical protein
MAISPPLVGCVVGNDHELLEGALMWKEVSRDHRKCKVTNQVRARYDALIEYKGKCWENTEPMTVPEFKAFILNW